MRKIVPICLSLMLATAALAAVWNVTYRWTRPTTGSPVVSYEVELSDNGGTTWVLAKTVTDTFATLQLTPLKTYLVRVRGVDALNRKGVYSPNADPFTPDDGVSGAPGKPVRLP